MLTDKQESEASLDFLDFSGFFFPKIWTYLWDSQGGSTSFRGQHKASGQDISFVAAASLRRSSFACGGVKSTGAPGLTGHIIVGHRWQMEEEIYHATCRRPTVGVWDMRTSFCSRLNMDITQNLSY